MKHSSLLIEAQHLWGTTVLDTVQLRDQGLTVGARGDGRNAHFDAPPFEATVDCFPLLTWSGAPRVTVHASFRGWVVRASERITLSEWAQGGRPVEHLPGATSVTLDAGEIVEIERGAQTFRLRAVSPVGIEKRPSGTG
ncbi:MAG: hypothetical protein HYV07_32490 [Deltaproteobacteria bacterium]|nr:hypothetical protein [Deltaproteobacteria bacterium]